ncbi:phenylalanine--tRNA ligase beta subunit [Alphaproteobacteria bacterium]|nr:phenylalanine--tRNA ligase beta subunit [Alphaproteobacteria bacterium]
MKFTLDWLFDHLKTDLSACEIADKLTALGIEVEALTDNNKKFDGFVVGYIKNAEKHPNADKLRVCQVDIGSSVKTIVCGAPNAREGIFVVVAQIGAIIPASNEPLKKSSIRQVESDGMMCSADELLIDFGKHEGIIELDSTSVVGSSAASALGLDTIVFDVSITPNRADCFCVRGIARDLAALGVGELLHLPAKCIKRSFENQVDVEIKTKNCNYFSTTEVRNISGKTPDFIAKRLQSIGQHLIFPAVDIANYICLDVGQPLHIFDLDKVTSLVIRESANQERILTLDGKEKILPKGSVVVASRVGEPLSIAGIMGGVSSAVSADTANILIEAAYFDKISIAKTGQNLRLSSDSRVRFERGIDPEALDENVNYTLSLLSSICDCSFSETKKVGALPNNKMQIKLTSDKFLGLTGLPTVYFERAPEILSRLSMRVVSRCENEILVETPSFRHDLAIEEDLIEEILRMTGFDAVEEQDIVRSDPIIREYSQDKISDALVFNGFSEIETFSFVDKKTAELFANADQLITIKDALTTDFSVLRPSIIASHLKSLKVLQNKSQMNCKLFETGKRFFINDGKIVEDFMLTVTMSGFLSARNWLKKQENVSVFDVKAILEQIIGIVVSNFRLATTAPDYYHPGRSGSFIIKKDTVVAYFGEIHPSILPKLDITGPVVCCELFLNELPELIQTSPKQPLALSPFQPTSRDFSFIVDSEMPAEQLINSIKKLRIDFVKDVSIFDVYESTAFGESKKAIALEVLMQSDKSTLTDEQINTASSKIISTISKECNGSLREQ